MTAAPRSTLHDGVHYSGSPTPYLEEPHHQWLESRPHAASGAASVGTCRATASLAAMVSRCGLLPQLLLL
jgi:hypothetical protein